MNTNIFVPTKINVGFQNRNDTYTGKLAYVIYYDAQGKLRKEGSWNSWRDESIPNEEFDNEPTEGFVLNRRAGGVEESWGWNPRKTYCRVYDPRGFEFEITIANLLWILENCNSIKGKGLEGEFVYGWDGKDLVLVPVESPDYKEIQNKNKIIHNNEFIKAKDLIIGATYETLKGDKYVYMGKFDKYEESHIDSDCKGYEDEYYQYDKLFGYEYGYYYSYYSYYSEDKAKNRKYYYKNKGKHFFFIKLGNQNSKYSWERDRIEIFKSISRKFSNVSNEKCHERYINFVNMIESSNEFSPVDYSKSKVIDLPYENFERLANYIAKEKHWGYNIYVLDTEGFFKCINIKYDNDLNCFYYQEYKKSYYTSNKKKTYESIESMYNDLKPVYGEKYLANGKLFSKVGYYE